MARLPQERQTPSLKIVDLQRDTGFTNRMNRALDSIGMKVWFPRKQGRHPKKSRQPSASKRGVRILEKGKLIADRPARKHSVRSLEKVKAKDRHPTPSAVGFEDQNQSTTNRNYHCFSQQPTSLVCSSVTNSYNPTPEAHFQYVGHPSLPQNYCGPSFSNSTMMNTNHSPGQFGSSMDFQNSLFHVGDFRYGQSLSSSGVLVNCPESFASAGYAEGYPDIPTRLQDPRSHPRPDNPSTLDRTLGRYGSL